MARFREDDPERWGGGGEPPAYPLLTNKPGAVVLDPVRRMRAAAVAFALAIICASAFAAYVSTTIARDRASRHAEEVNAGLEQLLDEMNRRTADRSKNEAVVGSILEQNRRTLCELLIGADPTEKIDRLIKAYKCGTANDPIVEPDWSAPPGWPPLPGSQRAPAVTPAPPK